MIEPSYVTFEQATLLKELGFDEVCKKLYTFKGSDFVELPNSNKESLGVSAPEHWQVVEWLRVVKGIHIFLDYTYYDGFHHGFKWVKANGAFEEVWLDREPGGLLSYAELYSEVFDHILTKLKNGEIKC